MKKMLIASISTVLCFVSCDLGDIVNPTESSVVGNYDVYSFYYSADKDTFTIMYPKCSLEEKKYVRRSVSSKFKVYLNGENLQISHIDSLTFAPGLALGNKQKPIIHLKSNNASNQLTGIWKCDLIDSLNDFSVDEKEKILRLRYIEFKGTTFYSYYERSGTIRDNFLSDNQALSGCSSVNIYRVADDSLLITSKITSDSLYVKYKHNGEIVFTSNKRDAYPDYVYSMLSLACPNNKYPEWIEKEFKVINCQ